MNTVKERIPYHVAIIMDGNGRWAKERGLPKVMGHREGARTAERIMYAAKDLGIKILTLYTFSTENWKRSKAEVEALMRLLDSYLLNKTGELIKEGVRLNILGDIDGLPASVRDSLKRSLTKTCGNDTFVLNLALNYGGRMEIIRAAQSIARDAVAGEISPEDIDEKLISDRLFTKGMPDPDLLIRTSGEMRISNFLLWQISYSEIYVTPKLWPDFGKKDLEKAVADFQTRQRRYGGR